MIAVLEGAFISLRHVLDTEWEGMGGGIIPRWGLFGNLGTKFRFLFIIKFKGPLTCKYLMTFVDVYDYESLHHKIITC